MSFQLKLSMGKNAEAFIYKWLNNITTAGTYFITSHHKDENILKLEGGDLYLIRHHEQLTHDNSSFLQTVKEITGIEHTGSNVFDVHRDHLEGGIEIKGIANSSLITRNNNYDSPYGTIEFELWQNTDKARERWTTGWLYKIMDPQLYDKRTDQNNVPSAVQPLALIYVYCSDNSNKKPFAVVAFENVPALMERLRHLMRWDSRVPATDVAYWNQFNEILSMNKGKPNERQLNMWHVPLDQLIDLATITLVDQMPAIKAGTYCCSAEIQQTRIDYLTEHADKHIDTKNDIPIELKLIDKTDIRQYIL